MTTQLFQSGGVQTTVILPQVIYLDFDGELTSYNGETLTVDNVTVEDSGLTAERIAAITAMLNQLFRDQNVEFVTDRPISGDFSTVYIGRTSSFEPYGNFAGLAETVDSGNKNRNDNAFVMLDSLSSDESIAELIAHEAGHLLGTLDHGGEGLFRYAATRYFYYENNHTFTDDLYDSSMVIQYYSSAITIVGSDFIGGSTDVYWCRGSRYAYANGIAVGEYKYLTVMSGGTAYDITVQPTGTLVVSSGGTAVAIRENGGYVDYYTKSSLSFVSNVIDELTVSEAATLHYSGTTVNSLSLVGGTMIVNGGSTCKASVSSGGTMIVMAGAANNTDLGPNTRMIVCYGGSASLTSVGENASMTLHNGGKADGIFVRSGGELYISNGGFVSSAVINSGVYVHVYTGGITESAVVESGGTLCVSSGGTAGGTIIKSGGSMLVNAEVFLYGRTEIGGQMRVTVPGVTASDAEIVFDLTQRTVSDDVMLINLRNLSGGTFAVTVSADQPNGKYSLASYADGFSSDVCLVVDGTGESAVFTCSGGKYLPVDLNNKLYTLTIGYKDFATTLSIEDSMPVRLFSSGTLVSSAYTMSGLTLYNGYGLLLNGGGNLLTVSSGGKVIDTTLNSDTEMEVYKGGIVSGLVVSKGAVCTVSSALLQGKVEVAGRLEIQDWLEESETGGLSLVMEANLLDTGNTTPLVSGFKYVEPAKADVAISVSSDVKEGRYLLASGMEKYHPESIRLLVDGVAFTEQYEGQYTFTWKDRVNIENTFQLLNQECYTGVNYKGYNYVLSIADDNLYLDVKKNTETMVLYFDEDDECLAEALSEKLSYLVNTVSEYSAKDRCIIVHADSNFKKDYLYTFVGGCAPTEISQEVELSSSDSSTFDKFADDAVSWCSADTYTLYVSDHGGGIAGVCWEASPLNDRKHISVTDFASALGNMSLSTVCFEACLMSSIEVMTALHRSTDAQYAVASAENIRVYNDYKNLFSGYTEGKDASELYYQSLQKNDTFSQIALSETTQLNKALDRVGESILKVVDAGDSAAWIPILCIVDSSFAYGDWNGVKSRFDKHYASTDLGCFLKNLLAMFSDSKYSEIQDSINSALQCIPKVVSKLTTEGRYKDTSGLSVYFPISKNEEGFKTIRSVMPENWTRFVECIADYSYLSPYMAYADYSVLLDLLRLESGEDAVLTFSGGDTAFTNLVADSSGRNINIKLKDTGAVNDKITLTVTGGAESTAWSLQNEGGTEISRGTGSEISLAGLSAGKYVVKITPDTPIVFDLEFKADWSIAEDYIDSTSPNSTKETAFDITGLALTGLQVASAGKDWYSFEKANYPEIITISSQTPSALRASVYDTDGNLDSVLEKQADGSYTFTTCGSGFISIESTGGEKVCYNLVCELDSGIIHDSGSSDTPSLTGNSSVLKWTNITSTSGYEAEISVDSYLHAIRQTLSASSLDLFGIPDGKYQCRVRASDSDTWVTFTNTVSGSAAGTPQLWTSQQNGAPDLFFACGSAVWGGAYAAQHQGIYGGWTGTQERVSLTGKNRVTDVFAGSADANILVMTDDSNGDALFADDIYSAFPEGRQSRIALIDEIRAGAGDDVVDMTSQRFAYTGEGLTIRGGDGSDTIWANAGDNRLFGDSGNDRITGASGSDVIAGGSGNDSMLGGGGSDIFCFCKDWGTDTVDQLADGAVTLWFADNGGSWDPLSMTYTQGANTVKVAGVTYVTLKYGDDGSEQYRQLVAAGAFMEASSYRVYEEPGKGIVASL